LITKKDKASKILGAIKHILHEAPGEGKLLPYTSFCRPILEYADALWDPTLSKNIESLEILQYIKVRSIAVLKGKERRKRKRNALSLALSFSNRGARLAN